MISELYTIISNKLWDLSLFFGDLHKRWALASELKALGPCKCARFRTMQTYINYIFSYLLTFVSVSESFYIWNVPSNENIAEAPSYWLFLVQGGVGLSFQRGLDHRLLIWCLLTATVAEEGIEACCLITRVSRLRILQELMFSRERYRWNITSVFPPFVLVGPLLRYFFDQRQSVSLLPSLSLVYNGIVIGEQYSKLWQ